MLMDIDLYFESSYWMSPKKQLYNLKAIHSSLYVTWSPWSQWQDPLLIWVSVCVFSSCLKVGSWVYLSCKYSTYEKENKRERKGMNCIDSRSLQTSRRNIKIRLSGSKMFRDSWNFKTVACHHTINALESPQSDVLVQENGLRLSAKKKKVNRATRPSKSLQWFILLI